MKIGMRLHDFPRTTPEELARAAHACGFEAGQLAMQKALSLPADTLLEDATLARIRSAFEAEAVALPVLGCYVDPVHDDPAVREAETQKFLAHLQASVKLGALCVGTETSHFKKPEHDRPAAYRTLLHFVSRACETAERVGALVGIEPVAVHTLNTPALTRQLLSDVKSPALRIIFDFANLITPDNLGQLDGVLEDAMNCFGEKICAVHVKDGVFEGRDFINARLGTGVMRWQRAAQLLREINPQLCVLREGVWPDAPREEAEAMREIFG